MAEIDYSKLNKSARQERDYKYLSSREEYDDATQSKIFKGLGYFGTLYNIPANLIWNHVIVPKSGGLIKKKNILSSTTDASDIAEGLNNNLLYDDTFQNWKPALNLVAGIGFDLSTYMGGFGLSKLGKVASLKTGKLASFIDDGKIAYKALSDIPEWGLKAGQKLTKESSPKIWKRFNAVGGFTKEIPDLPGTTAEVIRQGLGGIKTSIPFTNLEKTILPGLQAKVVDGIDAAYTLGKTKVFDKFPDLANALRTRKDVEKSLRQFGNDALAQRYKEYINADTPKAWVLKETEEEASKIMNSMKNDLTRLAAAKGMKLEDYINTLDDIDSFGMSKQVRRDMNMAYQFVKGGGKLDETGKVFGNIFEIKNGILKPKNIEVGFIDPKFFDEYKDTLEIIMGSQAKNISRTKTLESLADAAMVMRNTLEDYVMGIYKQSDLLTKPKYAKSMDRIKRLADVVKGSARKYKGLSRVSINDFLNKRSFVFAKNNMEKFTDAERAIAGLVLDERMAKADNTVGEILDFVRTKNLDSSIEFNKIISNLKESGQKELADYYFSLKQFSDDVKKLFKKSEIKLDKKFIDEIKETNIGKFFQYKVEPESIREFYDFSIPLIELSSKMKVAKEIKALEFHRSLFAEGLEQGWSTVGLAGEKIDGYVNLENILGMEIPLDKVKTILGDKFHTYEKGRWFWNLRKDFYDALNADGYWEKLTDPSKLLPPTAWKEITKLFDIWQSFWKTTLTLMPFPSFHNRNILDNNLRVGAEYSILESTKFASDLKNAAEVLGGSGLFPWLKLVGKKPKDMIFETVGGQINGDQLLDMLERFGINGDNINFFGSLSEVGRNPMDILTNILVKNFDKESKLKLSFLNKIKKANPVGMSKNALDSLVNKGIELSRHVESVSRTQLFIKNLRNYSPEEAARLTDLVMIDYGDLSAFEKKVIRRIFPFYSFKKGITKYLIHKATENPQFFRNLGLMGENIEDAFTAEEDEFNKALLPEYLREASIQIGMVGKGKNRRPRILNLEGVTSFAEVLNFLMPFSQAKEQLLPEYKLFHELATNKDFFFKTPIERYEGETKNILGFEVPKRSILSSMTKNIRAVKFLEDLSKQVIDKPISALVGKDVSLTGRKGVKSFFGKGTVGTDMAEPFDIWFAKKIMGVQFTAVDINRAKQSLFWKRKDEERKLNTAIKRAEVRYKGDNSGYRSFIKKMKNRKLEDIKNYKIQKLSKTFPLKKEEEY